MLVYNGSTDHKKERKNHSRFIKEIKSTELGDELAIEMRGSYVFRRIPRFLTYLTGRMVTTCVEIENSEGRLALRAGLGD